MTTTATKTTAEMEALMKKLRAEMESAIEEKFRAEMESMKEAQAKKESIKKNAQQEAKKNNGSTESNKASNGGAGQGGKDNSVSDEDIKKELFVDSTHRLLFMDTIELSNGREYIVNSWDKCIALFVIAVQILAYVIMIFSVNTERDTNGHLALSKSLEIGSDYCTIGKLNDQVDNENFLDLLECSDFALGEEVGLVPILGAACLLLFLFVLPDFFEVFVLFQCSGWRAKMASVVIFLKGVLALVVGAYGSIQNGGAFSLMDLFFFVVGVVFVHDLDDKVGYMRDVLQRVDYPSDHQKCSLEIRFAILISILFAAWYILTIGTVSEWFDFLNPW